MMQTVCSKLVYRRAYKDMVRVEIKSREECVHGVNVGHPITYVLSKLHPFTDIDLHLCTQCNNHVLNTLHIKKLTLTLYNL